MTQKLEKFTLIITVGVFFLSPSVFAIWRPFSCQVQLIESSGKVVAKTQQTLDNQGPLQEAAQLDTTLIQIPEVSVILRPIDIDYRPRHHLEIYFEKALLGKSSFIYTQNRVDLTVPLPLGPSGEQLFLQAECGLGRRFLYGPL